jgi:hypothetical protein
MIYRENLRLVPAETDSAVAVRRLQRRPSLLALARGNDGPPLAARGTVNMRSRCTLLCLGLLWAACGGDSAANPDAPRTDAAHPDGASPDAASPDAGSSDGEVLPAPETPIADRPSRGTYQCQVARARTDHSPRVWGAGSALVATAGGQAFVSRRESPSGSPFAPVNPQFMVSTLGADGTLGPALTEPAIPPAQLGTLSAARRGDGFALVWAEGDRLRFAGFDAAGAVAVPPVDLVSGVDEFVTHRLAAGPDGGFGLVFDRQLSLNARELHFMVLDASGAVRLAPRRLDPPTSSSASPAPAPAMAAGPTGYAVVWTGRQGVDQGIHFAAADASGTETVARRLVSSPTATGTTLGGFAMFAAPTNALVATAGGYLVAWTEGAAGMNDASPGWGSGGWMAVQLARLDPAGVRLGAPVALRPPTEDVDEVEPSLVAFGDAVAVTWSRGAHIYACGGCTPDHRIDLLLIDPADLTPVSGVVSLPKDPAITGGGLLRRQVAVLGPSLLTTFRQTFHVHDTPASATFSCQR